VGSLIIQCCMYLFIWIRDARARGKSLQMFKLEKTQGGRIVTVQSLYAYVWGSLLTGTFLALSSIVDKLLSNCISHAKAIILLASRVFLLKSYYLSGSSENAKVWNLFALTPAVLGVLVYAFSNIKAAPGTQRHSCTTVYSQYHLVMGP
jgi:hypothetical protein